MSKNEKMNWKPLIVIILSMITMYLTSFGINVLLTPIVTDLNWSVSGLQFVIVAASLISGTLMVTAGKIGDKIGKKKAFLIGIIIYTVGITLVVLSPNSFIFSIAWSLIWPLGMVFIIPTSLALLMYYYEGAQRAFAFGIYGAVLSIISAFGPLLTGYLANEFGWRIALALSPVFGVLTIISVFSLKETKKDPSIKIDLLSVLLSVAAFGMFLISTILASQYGWFFEKRPFAIGESTISLGGLSIVPVLYAVSIILFFLFFKRGKSIEQKGGAPLLNIKILKNSSFTIGMILQSFVYFFSAALIFILSVFVQAGVGFDSFDTAMTTLPISLSVAVLAFFTPNLGQKIAPKWIIITGFILISVGLYILGQQIKIDMTPMTLIIGAVFFGVGAGLVMGQVVTITMLKVKPEENGEASGLSETVKEIIGQGFAIAFAGSILFGAFYTNMTQSYAEVESIELSEQEQQKIIVELEDTFMEIDEVGEKEFISTLPEKTQKEYANINSSSAESAFTKSMWILNLFAVACVVLSFFLPSEKLKASNE